LRCLAAFGVLLLAKQALPAALNAAPPQRLVDDMKAALGELQRRVLLRLSSDRALRIDQRRFRDLALGGA
jgi:hypothetical protein